MSALELRTLPDHINIGLECIKQYQSESKLPHYQLIKKQQILWHEKSNFTGSDRTKYDNDTGVELTHNQIRYDTCDNVTDVLDYIDQSHCESAFLKVNESIYDNHTPTNKSALQKRYKIRRFPVPPPSKKLKSFQWVKLSEDTVGWYLAISFFPICNYNIVNIFVRSFSQESSNDSQCKCK